MQNAGTVRISKSPWASPLMMVPKPNGEYRLCGDYRRLNAITIPDRFPIPHLQDFSANLHGATIFTKIDLAHAFHQIPMDEESIQKTAVITPFGLFEYTTIPFGLRNAPQTFQRHMTNILPDLPYAYTDLDDVLIASSTPKQHEEHLRTLCERLANHGLLINPAKCELGKKSLTSLKCLNSLTDWVDHLPMVLLSLRNLYKQDQKATTSEMLYGQCLRLPGDIVYPDVSTSFSLQNQNSYSDRLKRCMTQIRYVALRPTQTVHKLDPALETCTHVLKNITAFCTKEIDLVYCPSNDMLADIFTKGLSAEKFSRLRRKLGVVFFEKHIQSNSRVKEEETSHRGCRQDGHKQPTHYQKLYALQFCTFRRFTGQMGNTGFILLPQMKLDDNRLLLEAQ
ncbi:Reverse transcriptase domain [Trinorchestia longiramus]|nr:Reverse transcriptase domain [Trinorchestia longiramus]